MAFETGQEFAKRLDAEDSLARFRDAFHLPRRQDGTPYIYFCGHSLGLQPKTVRSLIEQELDDWANMGVEGHFRGKNPWYSYHELFRHSGARLVGAKAGEVVMMNSLTVNLHLMMSTFYQPAGERYKILIDEPVFPSDLYAVQSQIRQYGRDPSRALVRLRARKGEHHIRSEDISAALDSHGKSAALMLLSGVNFATGQMFDIPRAAANCHSTGCLLGLSLAHAVGNVPLELHTWNVDFAVWCNYKYVNAGPGAVGGCFVHEKHGQNIELPRLAGWWGNDPATRFQMDTQKPFVAQAGAAGWQLSNPPIFSLAPLKASLALFEEATLSLLRAKSKQLTGYLEFLLQRLARSKLEIITPHDPKRRGCALSLLVHDRADGLVKALERKGVLCDYRPPNIVRVAPVPLYNTFEEVWKFSQVLADALGSK